MPLTCSDALRLGGRVTVLVAGLLLLAVATMPSASGVCVWSVELEAIRYDGEDTVDGCQHCGGLPCEITVDPTGSHDEDDDGWIQFVWGCWDSSSSVDLFLEQR